MLLATMMLILVVLAVALTWSIRTGRAEQWLRKQGARVARARSRLVKDLKSAK